MKKNKLSIDEIKRRLRFANDIELDTRIFGKQTSEVLTKAAYVFESVVF